MPSSAPGPLIADRYEVVRTLGQGSFGRTFLAHDRVEDRTVAIKVMDTGRVESWKGFELFEREAAVLRSVRHHGVPEIHDSFRAPWEGREAAFLVMEFVEGPALLELIEGRHHLDPGEASHILLELLGILDYLHGRVPPILHRDIKPANILVRPDGFPALVDFGAVRSALHPPGADGSTIVGTYGYMPYEQHMGRATPASDLYALAATYLHLVTGRPPAEFMNQEGRIEVPDGLPGGPRQREVLARMLCPAPTERFQSAREVRQALLTTGTAPTPARGSSGHALTELLRRAGPPMELPPAPRALKGVAAQQLRNVAPTAWRYLSGDREGELPNPASVALVGFLSFVTGGLVPLFYIGRAQARRRRLRRFFQKGTPALAVITRIDDERVDFQLKLTRVRYEWEADGGLHRGSDEVYAWIADRWRAGDEIQVLYLPQKDYDSVIVSSR